MRIIPVIFIPVLYLWYLCEPAILYLAYSWRHRSIRRFIKLADDIRMRHDRSHSLGLIGTMRIAEA